MLRVNLDPLAEAMRDSGDRLAVYVVIAAGIFTLAHFSGCLLIALAIKHRP